LIRRAAESRINNIRRCTEFLAFSYLVACMTVDRVDSAKRRSDVLILLRETHNARKETQLFLKGTSSSASLADTPRECNKLGLNARQSGDNASVLDDLFRRSINFMQSDSHLARSVKEIKARDTRCNVFFAPLLRQLLPANFRSRLHMRSQLLPRCFLRRFQRFFPGLVSDSPSENVQI